ncbi:hypothetical protein QFC21_007318 [Naganishia friedmannii]|uniref:Uncharacterized protein n=1 Tax=Naganishia friedmannii TaxID=89922 RepID=A0ACC2UXM4_9TREE|nr:hypothetical protein QFC21_007318 [Naganishia friedmannii]
MWHLLPDNIWLDLCNYVVIVTPLKALQVEQIRRCDRDLKAVYVNEDNKTAEIMKRVWLKEFERIFVTSEQLKEDDWGDLFRDEAWFQDVQAIIIDEAHVVVE